MAAFYELQGLIQELIRAKENASISSGEAYLQYVDAFNEAYNNLRAQLKGCPATELIGLFGLLQRTIESELNEEEKFLASGAILNAFFHNSEKQEVEKLRESILLLASYASKESLAGRLLDKCQGDLRRWLSPLPSGFFLPGFFR